MQICFFPSLKTYFGQVIEAKQDLLLMFDFHCLKSSKYSKSQVQFNVGTKQHHADNICDFFYCAWL